MTPKRILATGILALSMGTGNAEEYTRKVPRFKLDSEGWAAILATGSIAAADHITTAKIINAGGYETNGLIRNPDGTVNYKRATILDAATLGLTMVYYGVFKQRTPEWAHRYIMRPLFIGAGVVRLWNGPVHNVRLCNSSGRC